MFKKIFIVSSVVFVLALGILFFFKKPIFLDFGKKTDKISNEPTKTEKSAENKPVVEEKIDSSKNSVATKIIEGDLKTAGFNSLNGKIYYFNNKNFLSADIDGKNTMPLASYPFVRPQVVSFNQDFSQALIQDDGKFIVFDLNTKSISNLENGVDWVVWDRLGGGIIYKYFDNETGKRTLKTAFPDQKNERDITEIPYKYLEILPNPKSEEVLIYPKPDGNVSGEVFLVDLLLKEKKKLIDGKPGMDFLWSPDGKKLLYSQTVDGAKDQITLGIFEPDSGKFQDLKFPTSVRKCVWYQNSTDVLCAFMAGILPGSILPNDWQTGKIQTNDVLWKIDTQTGKKEKIYVPNKEDTPFDGSNFFLDKSEQKIFFIDKNTNDLIRIDVSN